MTKFENVEKRIINTYLETYPDFYPDKAFDGELQKFVIEIPRSAVAANTAYRLIK